MVLTTLFAVLVAFRLPLVARSEHPTLYGEYDFVVVGAGSSGAVLANRLSEVPEWQVLLLEAGGEAPRMARVPFLSPFLQNTDVDRAIYTEPDDRTCLSLTKKASLWRRGNVLGGSSVVNFMMYVRGNRRDYDHWESLGNPGWGYDDVLPYFKKSEDFHGGGEYTGDEEYRGKGGYLSVEGAEAFQTPMADLVLDGAKEMGYQIRDCNGRNQTGFMLTQRTTVNGERCSTDKAFLDPVRGRRNLHITTFAHVHKIIIDEATKTATGVVFKSGGKLLMAKAKKEIVLSAGSIGSPHLLLLSGIGPTRHLENMGVPVVQHLPGVGRNLQDHVATILQFLAETGEDFSPENVLHPQSVMNWLHHMPSALNIPGSVETTGFVNTKFSDPAQDWPDIQITTESRSPLTNAGLMDNPPFSIEKEAFRTVYSEAMGQPSWIAFPTLLRPQSRGHLQLKSTDPEDNPIIFANYFDDERDLKVLIEGVKIALELSKTKPLYSINTTIWKKPYPGCENYEFDSDEFWECHLRHMTLTFYHYSGTCKMGPKSDEYGVLDSRLRVRGITSLRVADASIMPTLVSGNTNAASVMIGEKSADLIKEDWLL